MTETKLTGLCACHKSAERAHPMVCLSHWAEGEEVARPADCQFAVLLRKSPTDRELWGGRSYDFTDACLSFHLPGTMPGVVGGGEGWLLAFHPDLMAFTPLAMRFSDFTFFHYLQQEALHLSQRECGWVTMLLDAMRREMEWGVDAYAKGILCNLLEGLLLHAQRFYHRQMTTRHDGCSQLFGQVTKTIDRLLTEGKVKTDAIYDGTALAQELGISTAYLDDVLRYITGKGLTAYSQLRKIELARQMLMAGRMTDNQIVHTLGFPNEKYFRCLFYRFTDMTVDECRRGY